MVEPTARSEQLAADAGSLAHKAAKAADPSRSVLGRATEAVGAVQLGARLIPAGWRLLKRYPLAASVAAVVAVSIALMARSRRSVHR